MANDVTIDDVAGELTEAVREACIRRLELPGSIAIQHAALLLDVLIETLENLRVSFHAAPRFNREAIAADWDAGLPPKEIASKHGCSVATVYRMHPAKAAA